LCPSLEGEIVALDGKTACGSRDTSNGVPAIHVVSAFSCGLGLTLGQVKTQAKSNEITALPLLIDMLDLQGATVTIDAMGCVRHEVAYESCSHSNGGNRPCHRVSLGA